MAECQQCRDHTHPFKCFVCEHPGALEYYKKASSGEAWRLIEHWKVCKDCATAILDAVEKHEIERSVA